jgi:protein-S-isoprenylcysteine O-methyltransferase Ste14
VVIWLSGKGMTMHEADGCETAGNGHKTASIRIAGGQAPSALFRVAAGESDDRQEQRSAIPSISSPALTVAVLFGLAAGCVAVFYVYPNNNLPVAALEMILFLAVPCATIELLVHRSAESAGLQFSRLATPSLPRLLRKLAALWLILAVLSLLYMALPIYATEFYHPFRQLWAYGIVPLLLLSIPYVALVDTMQNEPQDTLWALGERIFSGAPNLGTQERNYLLGWLVKGFFFPLMFCYLCGQISDIRNFDTTAFRSMSYMLVISRSYDLLFLGFFFVDLVISATGYLMTFRLLGTQIRSVEPTLLGWLVAIICYQPFYSPLYNNFFVYGHDRPWGAWLSGEPVFYTIWALMIIACLSFYVWATICFGIRFSNLTNRGIITTGPYRWTKHPAYVAKNVSWWLVSIPFLPPDNSPWTAIRLSIGLLFINVIYFMRAKTEERHLMADPVYRAYAEAVNRNGIFRWVRFGPPHSSGLA